MEKPRVGVSRCLLGHKVRYDGGHQMDRYLVGTLGQFVDFVPVCPEVECGLPVPREAMRLVGDPAGPRLLARESGRDLTGQMLAWAGPRLEELAAEKLCGFVFKSGSPSSGLERVRVYAPGRPQPTAHTGVGIFARAFMDRFPLLPVEDEGRLNDARLRENFIERLFVQQRWSQVLEQGGGQGELVDFHTRHKLLILAHSPETYRDMGRLVAQGKARPPGELREAYAALLAKALRLLPTVKKHVNVLMHGLGYFKKQLSADEKQEMLEVLDRYARQLVPLIVPLTLLGHYVRKYAEPYLGRQFYLNPHPAELRLRNHV